MGEICYYPYWEGNKAYCEVFNTDPNMLFYDYFLTNGFTERFLFRLLVGFYDEKI